MDFEETSCNFMKNINNKKAILMGKMHSSEKNNRTTFLKINMAKKLMKVLDLCLFCSFYF